MFIYKTIHESGKYYIGRCSRKHPETYLGSGRWVKSIKDKSTLTREILSIHTSFEELCLAEEKAINEHINDPLCMNWNNKSVGFASGNFNPSKTNPPFLGKTHSQETKRKISELKKEWLKDKSNHPMFGKQVSDLVKQRTAEVNSCAYEITLIDGTKQTITNMRKWCKENGHSDIVFHRKHKEGKPYKGMTYEKLEYK